MCRKWILSKMNELTVLSCKSDGGSRWKRWLWKKGFWMTQFGAAWWFCIFFFFPSVNSFDDSGISFCRSIDSFVRTRSPDADSASAKSRNRYKIVGLACSRCPAFDQHLAVGFPSIRRNICVLRKVFRLQSESTARDSSSNWNVTSISTSFT